MSSVPPSHRTSPVLALALVLGALTWLNARSAPAAEERLDGFNVIVAPGHPFGSATARTSLADAKRLGAHAIAVIPFLWQSTPASPQLLRGIDMADAELHAAIRDAHTLGLAVLVKPHVWVPESWAGAVAMNSEEAWQEWFADYRRELDRIARIAADEKTEALVIGTELTATMQRPEWNELIAATRAVYSGRLIYVAHNVEEAESVPFWDRLDAIGVTLYPPLGADDDRDGRRSTMRAVADRLDALAARTGKSILIGEVGLRSAAGAAAKPWESAEERASRARSGAAGGCARRLARGAGPAGDQWRPDLALVHRSERRRPDRHRFHRSGQARGTRSLVRVGVRMHARSHRASIAVIRSRAAPALDHETLDQNWCQTPRITPFSCSALRPA